MGIERDAGDPCARELLRRTIARDREADANRRNLLETLALLAADYRNGKRRTLATPQSPGVAPAGA